MLLESRNKRYFYPADMILGINEIANFLDRITYLGSEISKSYLLYLLKDYS